MEVDKPRLWKAFGLPICIGVAVALLAACTTPAQLSREHHAKRLESVSFARREASEARGSKTCHVDQFDSAYKLARPNRPGSNLDLGLTPVAVRVFGPGRVGIDVKKRTYPGSEMFFLIGGKRYSGREDRYVMLDKAALAALLTGKEIASSWRDWPSGAIRDDKDVLKDFKASYNECLAFLQS